MATKDETKNAITTTPEAQVPAFLRDRIAEDAGKGLSTRAEDNIIPLVYVLQAQSPQCNRRGPDYVEGAETGAIWLRSSGLPAISGDEGIIFQPCAFDRDWVEWRPNRGGFAGRHRPTKPDPERNGYDGPQEAVEKEITDERGDPKKVWMLPNGNVVQETRYHIGRIWLGDQRMPYTIPMTGSGHTVSKTWMTRMNNKVMPGVKGAAPSWACTYLLRTKMTSNAKGEWMTWDIHDGGWVETVEDYDAGAALNTAFDSGEKGIETPMDDQGSSGGGGSHTETSGM